MKRWAWAIAIPMTIFGWAITLPLVEDPFSFGEALVAVLAWFVFFLTIRLVAKDFPKLFFPGEQ
jgi:hypothetical protein